MTEPVSDIERRAVSTALLVVFTFGSATVIFGMGYLLGGVVGGPC